MYKECHRWHLIRWVDCIIFSSIKKERSKWCSKKIIKRNFRMNNIFKILIFNLVKWYCMINVVIDHQVIWSFVVKKIYALSCFSIFIYFKNEKRFSNWKIFLKKSTCALKVNFTCIIWKTFHINKKIIY